jgi:sugar phosphate isomerase/epimerase
MFQTGLSRRGFLASGLAAAAAAGVRAGGPADPFGGFKVGAQSYTWRKFTLEQALARMQRLGLRHVEFATPHLPPDAPQSQIDAVLNLCRTYEVAPAAAGVLPFVKEIDRNRPHFEFAKALGIRVLSADPTPDAFDSLDKLCEEYQVAVAIHPHGPGANALHRWYSAEVILAAVQDHHPLIGACLDTGHLIRCAQPPFEKKLDPAEQIRMMGKRNFGLHLKDHDNEARRDVVYGEGALDVGAVLRALRDVGFEGAISIEYEANPDEPTDDVRACIDVVKAAVKNL